ncbi:hypothetical protein MTR_1g023450 [Medicago truncatula]|uniref:EDS1 EP domain-containing protein n=1 Tax=Medicago truncatula TaxID=3880 RepID=G7I5Y0_MEDTR|nr:hypothetical protein MTR_1g023450 [Medicago truncatula]
MEFLYYYGNVSFNPSMIKHLSDMTKQMVEGSLMKPRKEGAPLRTRWLYDRTTYRRMVEP